MSITKSVTVHCDRCMYWTDGGTHSVTSREARAAAKRWGWRHDGGGIDTCPECLRKAKS